MSSFNIPTSKLYSIIVLFAFAAVSLCVSNNQAVAQYSVAPNAFVIESPSRSTEMFIRMSPDAAPMEFNIQSYFAVPGTDSSGNFKLQTIDSLAYRDASPYLRFTPRRFILNAGEQQIVRITMINDTLPAGEFWSRIMTSAKLISEVNPLQDQVMSASMGLEIRTVSGYLYRKGSLRSEIEIGDYQAFVKNDSLFLDLQIDKSSNAAWLGSITVSILDQHGSFLSQTTMPTNAYIANSYRYSIPLQGVDAGPYTARVSLTTKRDDPSIPLIKAPDVSAVIPFVVKNQIR